MEPIQIAMQIAADAEIEEALILAFDDAMQAGTLAESDRIEMATIARRGLSRAGLLVIRPDRDDLPVDGAFAVTWPTSQEDQP